MIKFSVEKRALERATALLSQVSGLKSVGATPSETSGLTLTASSISLSNINEANGVLIENIPVTIMDGQISDHLGSTYMVNTKKLDSVVRGSGASVFFCIEESKIVLGENKRRYELAMFSTERVEPEETKSLGYKVKIKDLVSSLGDAWCITENAQNSAVFSSSLFSGTTVMSSDRNSILNIEHGGLFGEGLPDLMMAPDLFASCLTKVQAEEAEPGFTADSKRFVLKFDNITLYKTLTVEKFPKVTFQDHVSKIRQAAKSELATTTVLKAEVNLLDLKTKLKEIHSIVEADKYHLTYLKSGAVKISNHNIKGGAEGTATVDARLTVSPETPDGLSAIFSYRHLELISELFPAGKDQTVTLLALLDAKSRVPVIKWIAVYSEAKSYCFTPAAQ